MASPVRRGLVYAAAIGLLLLVWLFTLRLPLLDPDEGLHAAIAQEMLARGDSLTPTFLGQPFFDKPILFFWAQMASMQLPLSAEAGVRLPGLLFGALGAITTGLLAAELLGGTTGAIAACLYATMLLPLAEAQVAVHDVALVPWTNLSLLLLWRAHRWRVRGSSLARREPHRARARSGAGDPVDARDASDASRAHGRRAAGRRTLIATLAGVGLCFGLAILTKGLSGVALVSVAAGGVLIATRQLTVRRVAALAGCLLIGLLVAAPWYLAMEQAHPGYLHYYFVERHLLGYVAAAARHAGKPWWYYLPVLLGGAFPWVAYLLVSALDQRRRPAGGDDGERDDAARALLDGLPVHRDDASGSAPAMQAVWIWLAAGLLFLTIGRVKLWTYALPLFPAIAILAAAPWARRLDTMRRDVLSIAARAAGPMRGAVLAHAIVGAALLPAVIVFGRQRYGVDSSAPLVAAAVAIAAGYALALWLFVRGRTRAAFGGLVTMLVATVLVTMTAVMPPVAQLMSERDLARHFNRLGHLPPRLWLIDDRVGSFVFYLDPVHRRGLTPERVRSFSARSACVEVAAAPPDTVVAVREGRAAGFLRLFDTEAADDPGGADAGDRAAPAFDRAGQFRVYQLPDLTGARGGRPPLVACGAGSPDPASVVADVVSR